VELAILSYLRFSVNDKECSGLRIIRNDFTVGDPATCSKSEQPFTTESCTGGLVLRELCGLCMNFMNYCLKYSIGVDS